MKKYRFWAGLVIATILVFAFCVELENGYKRNNQLAKSIHALKEKPGMRQFSTLEGALPKSIVCVLSPYQDRVISRDFDVEEIHKALAASKFSSDESDWLVVQNAPDKPVEITIILVRHARLNHRAFHVLEKEGTCFLSERLRVGSTIDGTIVFE